MNMKKRLIMMAILLLISFGISCNCSLTYATHSGGGGSFGEGTEIDFSWNSIKQAADGFISNGAEGANYISSDSMSGLVNRHRKYINYHRRRYCFSWNFSDWYTIYDGNTRRGSKIKNKISRTSNSWGCYIRCLGNLELNTNFFGWNTISKNTKEDLDGYILYTT